MIRKPLVVAVGIALRASTAGAQDVPGAEVCTMQQPDAKRDEETERCGYNDSHQFRQAPMMDATSTQAQGR
jgi:hypothetical protein